MCYPARLLGSLLCCVPVGASRCFLGSVALLVVLGWTLLVLSCCSPFVWLLSLSFLFPSPRGLSCLVPSFSFCWYLPLGIWLQLLCLFVLYVLFFGFVLVLFFVLLLFLFPCAVFFVV